MRTMIFFGCVKKSFGGLKMKLKRCTALIIGLCLIVSGAFAGCDFFPGVGNGQNTESSSTIASNCELSLIDSIYNIEDEQCIQLNFVFEIDGEPGDVSLLTFASNKENVATVSADGTVRGVATGKAEITISIGEESAVATVFVTTRTKRVDILEKEIMVFMGQGQQVTATAYNGKKEDKNASLTWQSIDETIATVDANGLVTAVAPGETEIIVSYGKETDKVAVMVAYEATAANVNSFSEEYINVYGRSYVQDNRLHLDYVAGCVELGIVGTSLTADLTGSDATYLRVYVDDDNKGERYLFPKGSGRVTLAEGLSDGPHKIRIVNTMEHTFRISAFQADKFWAIPEKSNFKIEFIGDSISAGYGVLANAGEGRTFENSDGTNTYAYYAANELQADFSVVASSGMCITNTNAVFDMNMETFYGGAMKKGNYTPDVVVLNMGTNDAMRDPDFANNYQKFLTMLRSKYPNAYIICLYGMMEPADNIVKGIQQSLSNLSDPKIVYNPIEIIANGQGAENHPNVTAQKAWGKALATYIKSLFAD